MPTGITFLTVQYPARINSVRILPAGQCVGRSALTQAVTQTSTLQPVHSPMKQEADPAIETGNLLKEIEFAIQELHVKQRQSLDELQACAVELAISAATWLTGVAIEQEQFDLTSLVGRAVNRLGLDERPSLALHPLDLALLRQRIGPKSRLFDDAQLLPDSKLIRGSCRIENSKNAYISNVANRLEDLRRIWIEELSHAQIERRTSESHDRKLQRVPDRRDTA